MWTSDPFPFLECGEYKYVKGFPLIWALYKHSNHSDLA